MNLVNPNVFGEVHGSRMLLLLLLLLSLLLLFSHTNSFLLFVCLVACLFVCLFVRLLLSMNHSLPNTHFWFFVAPGVRGSEVDKAITCGQRRRMGIVTGWQRSGSVWIRGLDRGSLGVDPDLEF